MLAIHFSAERGHKLVIEYLLSQMISRLDLDKKTALQLTDSLGNNILHYSAMKKRLELMEWLISQGCDETEKNNEGETPQNILDKKPKILYTLESSSSNSENTTFFTTYVRSKI